MLREGPDKSFERYSLHAGIAQHVEPAGPPPWSVTPAKSIPQTITRRSQAEVALDLSRVFNYIVGRGSVKVRKDGSLGAATVQAMAKAVPLDDSRDFQFPDPHGFYCELLRYIGVLRIEGDKIVPDFERGDSPVQRAGVPAGSLLGARLAVGPALV